MRSEFTEIYVGLVGATTGFAILTFESAWSRMLPPFVGNPVVINAWITCSMFIWLLLGGLYFARKAAGLSSQFRLLAFTQIGAGISAILASQVFPAVHAAVGGLQAAGPGPSQLAVLTGGALASAVVFVPFFLLGGIVAFCLRIDETAGPGTRAFGRFLGAALAGYAAAALISAFGLLPLLGYWRTLIVAAVAIAVTGLIGLFRGEQYEIPTARDRGAQRGPRHRHNHIDHLAYGIFLVGALTCAILWARFVTQVIGPKSHTWALLVGVYFACMAIGSSAGERISRSTRTGLFALGLIGMSSGIVLLALARLPDSLPLVFLNVAGRPESAVQGVLLAAVAVSVLTMLAPGVLTGCSLSVFIAGSGSKVSRRWPAIASIYAAALVALVLTRLIPNPGFGLHRALTIIPWLCMAGGVYFIAARRPIGPVRVGVVVTGVVVALVLAVSLPRWDPNMMTSGVFARPREIGEIEDIEEMIQTPDVTFYEETPAGIVAVLRTPDAMTIKANGVRIGSMPDGMIPQMLTGHIGLLMHPQPKEVLVIGLSNGVTVSAVASHPVDRIVCVEPLASIVTVTGLVSHFNDNVLQDRRVSVHIGDASNYLLSGRTFDVIFVEQPSYSSRQPSDLSTVDFARQVRSRLKPGGIACWRLQTGDVSPDVFRSIARGFASLFPSVSVWWAPPDQAILLGSTEPVTAGVDVLAGRIADRGIGEVITRGGLGDAVGLMNWFLMGRDRLMHLVGDAGLITIDRDIAALDHLSATVLDDPLTMLRILHGGSEPVTQPATDTVSETTQADEIRQMMSRCMRARLRYLDALDRLGKGLLPQAISLLEEAANLCSSTAVYRVHLATHLLHYSRALAAAGRLDDAIGAARRSIEANPYSASGFYRLASLEANRDVTRSIALLGRAVELSPHYVPAYLLKARLELASRQVEQAGKTLGTVLSVEPLNLKAHHLRALSLIQRDMLAEARMELDRVIEADPDNFEVIDALAYTWLLEGDLDKAGDLYEDVLEADPDNLPALNNFATVLAEKGDYDRAVRIWTRALSLDPGNRNIMDNIEEARQKMRQR